MKSSVTGSKLEQRGGDAEKRRRGKKENCPTFDAAGLLVGKTVTRWDGLSDEGRRDQTKILFSSCKGQVWRPDQTVGLGLS
jgi:hypothetical protein